MKRVTSDGFSEKRLKLMYTKRLILLLPIIVILLTSLILVALAQEPAAYSELMTGEATVVFQADVDNLQPCGAYEQARRFHDPEPVTATPSSTPDLNAATPTPIPPTSTPRPAPAEDRVGFPANYAADFKLLFILNRPDKRLLRVICGNDIAAQRQPGMPFAYGSVLLMMSFNAQLDANQQPVLDENGDYIGEKLVSLHVQRKEPGFGEAYGADRAGEWEFMLYNADGSAQTTSRDTNVCAVCHGSEAGEAVDNVFRMNLFYEDEEALIDSPAGENEISIDLYSFHDPVLEVKAGTTVTWVNNDEANHTVVQAVIDDTGRLIRADEPLFETILMSFNIAVGDRFSYTFDKPGEYLYRCLNHEHMSGRIIVTP